MPTRLEIQRLDSRDELGNVADILDNLLFGPPSSEARKQRDKLLPIRIERVGNPEGRRW